MARQLAALILLVTTPLAAEPFISRSSPALLAAQPAAEPAGQAASGRGESAPPQPQAVVDHLGLTHLVFGAGNELKYCRWNPNTQRFDLSRKIPRGV
ncbi:MAG: hypothetical protein U0795_26215 [Pirellulales bacterium]